MSTSKMASKRFSSEKSSVLTKEALADLNLHEFDILPNWEPTSGKIYTKVRAISARINQNFDGWPSEELKKSYRTFLGKPVFVNHVNDDPRKARGVVVAARFVENGDDKYIEVIQEVDADKFPKLAHELISGGLDSVSMGAEARICKCSYCGNEASDMLSMCSHVLSKKGQVLGRVNDDGTREDVLVFEECRDVSFFELSYVFDPADETAVVSNVLTANRKRGYGETSLPPQVDTLRDEEEDLAGYFIDPPREFQEPDLDEDYPVVEEGQPFGHRRDEEQREDFNMSRVSRNRRRQTRTRQAAPHPSGIDFDALLGEGWENEHRFPQERQPSFDNWDGENYEGPRGTGRVQWEGDNDLSWENSQGESGRTKGNIWDAMQDVEDSLGHYSSNRRSKGNRMSHNRRARRRYAEEFGRNDQGEQEEVFISQTPPAEPVETGDGAADAPNNTKSDRVKTDQNRSNHTNLEARRRRARRRRANGVARAYDWDGNEVDVANTWQTAEELARAGYDVEAIGDDTEFGVSREEVQRGVDNIRREIENYDYFEDSYGGGKSYDRPAPRRRSNRRRPRKTADSHELYKDFLEYAQGQGMDLDRMQELYYRDYETDGMDAEADYAVHEFEEMMYDFLGVNSVDEDDRLYTLMEAPGSYEINHPDNFRGASRKRRSNRRRSNRRVPRKTADYNGWSNWETWNTIVWYGNDPGAYDIAKGARSPEELAENAPYVVGDDVDFDQVNWDEVYEAFEEDRTASRRRSNRRRPSRRARRRMAEQSDDFNLNSRADIARDVEDEEVFISETDPQTQPKDASRKRRQALRRRRPSRSRRTAANGWANWDTWHANMYLGDNDDVAREIAFADSGQQVADMFSELLEGTDVDPGNVDWDELHDVYSSDRDYYKNASRKRRSSKRRRMADTNLDLAAPDGRVNVEAPVKDTTDEEAQASQFDKKDFGNNAGDHLADPDLSTDQNWAPGEGQKTSTRASEIEGMRLAEAMVEAGLEDQEDRWKLAEAYTKLPANIVRDRIALLARTASAKSAVRDDKSQRPVKSAQKAPGLGQRPTLQKSANKSDDYTLYL